MTFARRFPAHLLPQVEDALAHLLHNVGEGEWVVVVPVGHAKHREACPDCGSTAKSHFCPGPPKTFKVYSAGELDEQPTIHGDDNDGA